MSLPWSTRVQIQKNSPILQRVIVLPGMPIQIQLLQIVTKELYIHGDLYVSGILTADVLYVSGEIYGTEQIQCDDIYSGYANAIPYQTRVLERTAA